MVGVAETCGQGENPKHSQQLCILYRERENARDKVAARVFRVSTSKTPPSSETPHNQRRQGGGARTELSERVTLRWNDLEATGWTLNMSRGGLRAVVESPLDPELEYLVAVGDGPARRACLVWSKGEADGQIVGLRFLDVEGSVPPEE